MVKDDFILLTLPTNLSHSHPTYRTQRQKKINKTTVSSPPLGVSCADGRAFIGEMTMAALKNAPHIESVEPPLLRTVYNIIV